MKKTKIICTLGPATDRKEILVKMIESGMDLARFNFSHGSHEECAKRLALLKEAIAETGRVIGFIGDTKGPEMRLGLFKGDKVTLKDGDAFTLTAEACEGTAEKAHVNYSGLPQEVKKGDTILLNDGKLTLRVESTTDTEIHTTVTNGGACRCARGYLEAALYVGSRRVRYYLCGKCGNGLYCSLLCTQRR